MSLKPTSAGRKTARFLKHVATEIDASNGNHATVLEFSTARGPRRLSIPRSEISSPRSASKLIMDKGALLPPDYEAILRAIAEDDTAAPTTTVVHKGGWHGGVFVCPYGVFGNKEKIGRYRLHAEAILKKSRRGSRETFATELAPFLRKSDIVFLTYVAALAASFGARAKLTEGFAINVFGESSTGKTTALCVAQAISTVARERDLVNINQSPKIVYRTLSAFVGMALPFTDIKGATEKGKTLADKLQAIAFTAAGSGVRETYGEESPAATAGFCIPITSSEMPLAQLFQMGGVKFDGGEGVRHLDVPVGRSAREGGIFKCGSSARSIKILKKLVALLARHHGQMLPHWIYLLSCQSPAELKDSIDAATQEFIEDVGAAQGPHFRIAGYFGVLAATVEFAVQKKVLIREIGPSLKALKRIYETVVESIDDRANEDDATWERLNETLRDQLPMVEQGKKSVHTCEHGFRRREDAGLFAYIKSSSLKEFLMNDRVLKNEIMPTLLERGIITAAKGGNTMTVMQAGISGKPRYYRFDLKAFRAFWKHG